MKTDRYSVDFKIKFTAVDRVGRRKDEKRLSVLAAK